jgi:hypothetical protein
MNAQINSSYQNDTFVVVWAWIKDLFTTTTSCHRSDIDLSIVALYR